MPAKLYKLYIVKFFLLLYMRENDRMGEFAGKIVVVTGGSKGIGESIVRRFWEAGARCVIVSRHPDECQALADELKAAGMTVNVLACDVRKVGANKESGG